MNGSSLTSGQVAPPHNAGRVGNRLLWVALAVAVPLGAPVVVDRLMDVAMVVSAAIFNAMQYAVGYGRLPQLYSLVENATTAC